MKSLRIKISAAAMRLAGALCLLALTMSGPQARGQQTREESGGVVVGNIDPAVKPGEDFFRYCNGAWLKGSEIPADRGSVGAVLVLRDKSDQRVKGLVEGAAKANAGPGTNARKIADLFHSYMDEAGIEAKAMAPLEPHFKALGPIPGKKGPAVP